MTHDLHAHDVVAPPRDAARPVTELSRLASDTKLLAAQVHTLIPATSWQHIDARTPLPPLHEIERLLLAADRTLAPCGREAAKQVTAMMLGCYPNAKPHDPDTYVRGIISILQELPLDIAWQVADTVTRTVKFLPTRSELHEAAQALLAPRLAMRDLLRAARREAQRRAAQPPQQPRTRIDPQTAAQLFAEIKAIIARTARGVVDTD